MADYIAREKLQPTCNQLATMGNHYIKRSYMRKMAMLETAYKMEKETDAAVVLRMIEDAPAACVAHVRHGRWKYYHKQNKAVCTECSFERDLDADFGKAVSCPNCGAKMDLERSNEQ